MVVRARSCVRLAATRSAAAPPLRRRYATQNAQPRPSVLVIGAGASGLTLAISLLRRGIKADVIEQMTPDLAAYEPSNAEGVYLPVTTMLAFQELGVNAGIERAGSVLKESRVLSDKGGVIGRVNLSGLAKSAGVPGAVGINYRQLLKELSSAYYNLGGRIVFNSSFTKLKQNNKTVTCTFSGSRPTATYDLVVGADGAHSKVRDLIFDKKAYRLTKRYEKWGYYSIPVTRPMGIPADQISEYWGNGSRLTLIPTSAGTLSVRATFNSVYPPYAMKGGSRTVDDLLEIAKPRFTANGLDHLWKLLSAEKKPSLLVYPYEQKMQSWIHERIVLIGDAAHMVMPNYPGLTALGIEDGFVLGKYLAEKPSIEKALEDFLLRRFPRVFEAQAQSWAVNGPGQRANWFKRLVRAGTMFATHGNTGLTRKEKRIMGDKTVLS